MRLEIARWSVAVSLALVTLASESVWAQMDGPGGGGGPRGLRRGLRRQMEQMQQNAAPPANTTPDKPKEEKKDEKPAESKKDEGPKPIIRPAAAEAAGSLGQQRLTLDAKHMVSFNFDAAPWTFVLEELAHVSGLNLDWQKLPGDALNLRSNTKYTVAQARDIINEHLLARGYVTVMDPKISSLKVLELDNLNTALVPRVQPEDLDTLPPHDLAKVSFRLDWLLADKAVEEFKQILSPKAKLIALKTTNRLEAIDAVVNLKQLATLLDEEQGRGSLERLAKEFELRHTRAAEVVEQLEVFLGLKKEMPGAGKGAQDPQAQQMMMMQRMQMMQQQQQQQQGQQQAGAQQKPDVHLMANQRRNSIIVHAPPDQMAIIKAAIWKIDVPTDRPSLSENTQLMQPYRLATLDPEVVVSFLQSVGDLSPETRLEVDKKNHTVMAYAPPRDHKVIAALVKNLDGSDRQLKVIPLRRLAADDAAGTLRALLVGEDKSNNNNSSRRYYGWYNPWNSNSTEETTTSKFRVEADVANNRLMVWANQIELEDVYKMLAEMGEIPRREGGRETMRVLDLGGGAEEQEFLERLGRVWSTLGKDGNKLIIDVPKAKGDDKGDNPSQDESKPGSAGLKAPAAQGASRAVPSASIAVPSSTSSSMSAAAPQPMIRLADFRRVTAAADKTLAQAGTDNRDSRTDAAREKRGARSADRESGRGDPIIITRGTDGKLVISSKDTQALDQLEELMARLKPPRKDYAVFYLKHAPAYVVKLNLDDFFQSEKKENGEDRFRRWWWDDYGSDKKDDSPKLSRRKPLRFIEDEQTNSILVQGATTDQLRQIKELIDMYDNPKQSNTRPSRVTQMFYIKNSKASVVADVIKDVYRDLLSTKDKAMESYNQTKNQGRGGRGYISYDFSDHEDDGKMSQGKFSGYLSLGIDDSTNTLLVSCATQGLLTNIGMIVKELDRAAVPAAQTFQVLQINRSLDAATLQKKLGEMLKKPVTKQEQSQQPGQGQQQQQKRHNRGQQNQNNEQGENANGGGGGGE